MGLVVVTVLKLGFHCKRFPMWQKRFPKSFTEYEPVIRISLAFKSKLEQSRGGKMEDPIISKDSSHLACSWAKQLTCYQLGTKRFNCLGTKCPKLGMKRLVTNLCTIILHSKRTQPEAP